MIAGREGGPVLDRDVCSRALRTRDARFDGRFYTAVKTTGIYCRPICPARTPKLENCLFLPSAGAAHELGFRPCLRCRPESAPGSAGWQGTRSTVSRALRLIAEGGLDTDGVDELADRLGVGARQIRRLFARHLGASPVSVAQAHRILFAKKLLDETALSVGDVALAAGFRSIRRFNEVFRGTYARAPSELRRARRSDPAGVSLKLPFSPPYDWPAMIEFLAARAIPGVESVALEEYRRAFRMGPATGHLAVRAVPGAHHLAATIRTSDVAALPAIVARLRRLFDLDVNAAAVDEHLARDARLSRFVRARPGVRVPGAWDDFELAVRAVVGQQISVAAATTIAGRIAAFGAPVGGEERAPGASIVFPSAKELAFLSLDGIGLTRARARALQELARAVAEEPRVLEGGDSLEESVGRLLRLPGIGQWTAHYVAMRALREPDAFPASDLGLVKALAEKEGDRPSPRTVLDTAERWRPFRAYAAMRLWLQGTPRERSGRGPTSPVAIRGQSREDRAR